MQINNIEICVKISDSTINFNGAIYPCQIGIEGGVHYAKGAEGDKKTPIGSFKISHLYYRRDRIKKPQTQLQNISIKKISRPLGGFEPVVWGVYWTLSILVTIFFVVADGDIEDQIFWIVRKVAIHFDKVGVVSGQAPFEAMNISPSNTIRPDSFPKRLAYRYVQL